MAVILCNIDYGLYSDPHNININVVDYLRSNYALNDIFLMSMQEQENIDSIKSSLKQLGFPFRHIFSCFDQDRTQIISSMDESADILLVIDDDETIRQFCLENNINFSFSEDVT